MKKYKKLFYEKKYKNIELFDDIFTDSGIEHLIEIIDNWRKKNYYFAIGLRSISKKDEGKKILSRSKRWEDGTPTKYLLSGTSAISVVDDYDYSDEEDIKKGFFSAKKIIKRYDNGSKYIAILCGNIDKDEITEDEGEIVMPFPEVIGYFNRNKL